MSLENQIAQAVQQVGLAREEILDLANVTATQISAVGTAFAQRITTFQFTAYVDPANGLDTNSGASTALPLKTIQRALALTPPGGECIINLMNDLVINFDEHGNDIYVYNRALRIQSASAVQRNINFTTGSFVSGASTYRRIAGFTLKNRCKLDFFNLKLWMPDVGQLGGNLAAVQGSLIHISVDDMGGGHHVSLASTIIDTPATPYGPLLGIGSPPAPFSLSVGNGVGVTGSGVIDGKWFDVVTSQTNTSTLQWLRSNRATV